MLTDNDVCVIEARTCRCNSDNGSHSSRAPKGLVCSRPLRSRPTSYKSYRCSANSSTCYFDSHPIDCSPITATTITKKNILIDVLLRTKQRLNCRCKRTNKSLVTKSVGVSCHTGFEAASLLKNSLHRFNCSLSIAISF